MKKFALACALMCLAAPVNAATISGSSFAAVITEGANFNFGSGTALDDPASCDAQTGLGCDISLGDYSIDFVDEDTIELSLFDANRALGGLTSITFNVLGLDYRDNGSLVDIDNVSFLGASGSYNGLVTTDFTGNSMEVILNSVSASHFAEGQSLLFDITLAEVMAPIPVPGSIGLLGTGLIGLALHRRKTEQSKKAK